MPTLPTAPYRVVPSQNRFTTERPLATPLIDGATKDPSQLVEVMPAVQVTARPPVASWMSVSW